MKIKYASVALFAIASFVASAVAQAAGSPPVHYITLEYQKPTPGKNAAYVKMERELWKPIHQARVKAGNIVSWKLYVVSYPNGQNQEYEYITVTEYPSWAALEQPYAGIEFSAVLGEEKAKGMRGKTGAARKLVRRDTLRMAYATSNFSQSENKVLSVHYLKTLPGRAEDFMNGQRDYYLPMNSDVAKASGGASAWAATVVRYPDHADALYSHVSFNAHSSLSGMESNRFPEIQKKWESKFKEVSSQQPATRTRIRNELWRLVDQTETK
ncbi:MAG: hypothetical protein RIQ93_988 [Verrucomicrobiota bacterium]|jgi:hypothetical protein